MEGRRKDAAQNTSKEIRTMGPDVPRYAPTTAQGEADLNKLQQELPLRHQFLQQLKDQRCLF